MHTVALASRASSGAQNKGTQQESYRTSRSFPCYFTGGGHSCNRYTPESQIWSTEARFPRRVPALPSTTLQRWQMMARAILRQATVSAALSGGNASKVSSQLTPSGRGARYGPPQLLHRDLPRFPLLLFLLAPAHFLICWFSGSAGTSPEVSCAATRAILVWTVILVFRLPRQPWRKDAPR